MKSKFAEVKPANGSCEGGTGGNRGEIVAKEHKGGRQEKEALAKW